MSTNALANDAQVVRYIKPTKILDDGTIDGSAFNLKPDETGLSVNWYEIFDDLTKDLQLEEVRRLSRLNMRKNGCLAEFNVGNTVLHVRRLVSLGFVHKPLDAEGKFEADPSHSEIEGLPAESSPIIALVGDLIAECITSTHPAVI